MRTLWTSERFQRPNDKKIKVFFLVILKPFNAIATEYVAPEPRHGRTWAERCWLSVEHNRRPNASEIEFKSEDIYSLKNIELLRHKLSKAVIFKRLVLDLF